MSDRNWNFETITALFETPFIDLVYEAQTVHRQNFEPSTVQLSTLKSIKTGACPEDCAYCPQSGHYNADLEKESLLDVESVLADARDAKAAGASRFCMGAAWKSPPKKEFPKVVAMIKGVKELGLESCVTLGMLEDDQAEQLADAGLDYYNHNLDTSPDYYKQIITTRTYQDRLDTLAKVRDANINVCCGGIVGMGEAREDRITFLHELAKLPVPPESIPINKLIAIEGTPLEDAPEIDDLEFVRVIAAARIMMPTSVIRISAGRESMSSSTQTLAFMAGANSIFLGETLLTAANPSESEDRELLESLGMQAVL